MRLHSSTDWAPAVCFSIAGALMLILPAITHAGTVYVQGMAIAFLVIALLSGGKALRGTKIPESATHEDWADVALDGVVAFFGIGMLTFGGISIASSMPGGDVWFATLAWGGIFAGYASWMLFRRKRTIVTNDHRILMHYGRPFVFYRRTWKTSDFHKLIATTDWQYAGTLGMISRWNRAWLLVAQGAENVVLLQCNSEDEARKELGKLAARTGIPAAPVISAQGPDQRSTVAP